MRCGLMVLGLLAALLVVPIGTQAQILDTLKPDHPRLLAHEDDFKRVVELVKHDALAKDWHASLQQRAEHMLDEPVTRYVLRDGRRLLYESRDVLSRVMTLAMLYRIEPDERYRERIWADMASAAAFKDWNPDHFLDVAVMQLAFALAYDWLYDAWTPEQRETLSDAIVKHGLEPGLAGYRSSGAWWAKTTNNWNQVCNGGMIAGALAVADLHPDLAHSVIRYAVASLPISMARYDPDGAYVEGPGYWGFGTSYNVYAIAMLESALGQDFGLSQAKGFDVTGGFPIHMTGPSGNGYNFADGSARPVASSSHFYLAKRFDEPAYARFATDYEGASAFSLLWYDPEILDRTEEALPLAKLFPSVGVAVVRSAWGDPDAWFLAAKGGRNGVSHGHLDLGSFILESQGVRWFIDLDKEDYNLIRYSGLPRTDFYRLRGEGHNTIILNPPAGGPDQAPRANAPTRLDGQTIEIDMTPVYGNPLTRTLTLDRDADQVRIVDTLGGDEPADVWWFAHTRAAIEIDDDGRGATLTQNGKRLRATLIEPVDARFVVMDARPLPASPDPEGQNPNNGAVLLNPSPGAKFVVGGDTPVFGDPDPALAIRKLAVHLQGVQDTRLIVEFSGP